ncbi:MAG: hypothetical protein A3A44_03430 [Candidatus Sungbacteria bacterium RIFCSPLOWO2_01_FULL_60_25]|uniref:Uncharacterized protein n=1 Tax=Candidatus Sungbacteria bacterium RIFCSPLOWO2_01_FULL_60_25 TaxID=1802281 RepID=A0A1G2LCI5_9BACT|nr:MAG: hypothetical protein A3A44_03430 [Candidatus Sungbacteria bacterium RIFCSPLOWO2_01_FULL_60_25]
MCPSPGNMRPPHMRGPVTVEVSHRGCTVDRVVRIVLIDNTVLWFNRDHELPAEKIIEFLRSEEKYLSFRLPERREIQVIPRHAIAYFVVETEGLVCA